jgi:hypothetical protein
MEIDESAWSALRREHDGVIRRDATIAFGWTPGAVHHRVGRSWQSLLPGVLLTVTGTPTSRQRALGARAWAGEAAALTAETGLAAWGLGVPHSQEVHVAVPHQRQLQPARFRIGAGRVIPHRTLRDLASRTGMMPVLPVARCVVYPWQGKRSVSQVRGWVSAAVQQRKATVPELEREVDLAPRAGSKVLRQVLSEVGEGACSAAETALVPALRGVRLPPFRLNVDVCDSAGC